MPRILQSPPQVRFFNDIPFLRYLHVTITLRGAYCSTENIYWGRNYKIKQHLEELINVDEAFLCEMSFGHFCLLLKPLMEIFIYPLVLNWL